MLICHKTEIQMVILRCLTSLNPILSIVMTQNANMYFHFRSRLTREKIATDKKWPFYDHFWPYFRQLCFLKLRFRRSFWGAEWVWTSIGSKVMTQNANEAVLAYGQTIPILKFTNNLMKLNLSNNLISPETDMLCSKIINFSKINHNLWQLMGNKPTTHSVLEQI